jgi:Cys-rich repeat protein
MPGDGCDGLIGLEHQNCRPGATPKFVVSITNPTNPPVPPNPNDPKGGYNFRVDLIGDGRFYIDSVPIYVIPFDIDGSAPPPIPRVEEYGEYFQDVSSSSGCTGNERPDWQNLTWNAHVPDGTSLRFSVCTAESEEALETCTYTEIATISSQGTCTTDLDCATGHCSAWGLCETITGGTCLNDMQCPAGAVCDLMINQCSYEGQPVYVGGSLGATNLLTYLRMNVALTANVATNAGPTVYDWALTYVCRNVN